MKADVIVPTYENTDLTLRCFESLRKHTDGYNLVWVDNGSSKDSREAVMEEAIRHAHYRVLWLPENTGFIGANNVALRLIVELWRTSGDYVVLLNNDVEATDGWLDRLVNIMELDPTLGAVGPVTSECESWQSYQHVGEVLDVFQVPDGFVEKDMDGRAQQLDYCYGELYRACNMVAFFCTLFRKDVFRRIGYLDEAFKVGLGDDDDLCKRMSNDGMRCALSLGTYVLHRHRSTFKNIYTSEEMGAMSRDRHDTFIDKHGEKATVHEV